MPSLVQVRSTNVHSQIAFSKWRTSFRSSIWQIQEQSLWVASVSDYPVNLSELSPVWLNKLTLPCRLDKQGDTGLVSADEAGIRDEVKKLGYGKSAKNPTFSAKMTSLSSNFGWLACSWSHDKNAPNYLLPLWSLVDNIQSERQMPYFKGLLLSYCMWEGYQR